MRYLPLTKDTVRLLRIPFSFYLMPVFLLSLSQAENINPGTAFWSFMIIHLLVYPASNGYNSYVDRDESSIGGLENPPQPTMQLFYTTLMLDILSVIISFLLVNVLFALCIFVYIAASRAYSCRSIRLKKYAFVGFFTVIFFQGPFTYYMSYVGITMGPLSADLSTLFILLATTTQIAGAYPLTQIYQHEQDKAAGVNTISRKLGIRGTFLFTMLMFVTCNVCYYYYFTSRYEFHLFVLLQFFFLPVIIYFLSWFYKTNKNSHEANFKNAMNMNLIASACSATCFIFFILLKL